MSEPVLQVKGLKTYYYTEEGVVPAVDGLDFEVEPGETFAIVGESGCGKSVTSLSILRLIPSPPGKIIDGEIIYHGQDLVKKSEREMRSIRGNDISMIFQEPMTSLNPVFTVGQQIGESFRFHQQMGKAEMLKKSIEMLRLVGIPEPEHVINDYPNQLSGGMRQRVMIAMALACNPKILIADEPTTALDVTIQAQIMRLLKHCRRKWAHPSFLSRMTSVLWRKSLSTLWSCTADRRWSTAMCAPSTRIRCTPTRLVCCARFRS